MDYEAWLKLEHVYSSQKRPVTMGGVFSNERSSKDPEPMQNRRNLIVQLARGFAAGDVIPRRFDGSRFLLQELARD